MSPVMGNMFDDGGWLHLAAPQADYEDQDAWLDNVDTDNDSVAGEASDVNKL
jgi:hypothetical protein